MVAGAVLATLSSLVDKSLIRAYDTGRYDLHELVRQFAFEKLSSNSDAETATRDRHSEYYAEFLAALEADLKRSHQIEALDAITVELDNVRVAWFHMNASHHTELVLKAIESYGRFCESLNRFEKEWSVFSQAISEWKDIQRNTDDERVFGWLKV